MAEPGGLMEVRWYGNDILQRIIGGSEDALYESAEEFLDDAQAKAPERTGTLKESAYVATSQRTTYRKKDSYKKQVKVPAGVVAAGFAAFYAHFVEFGTSKMAAQPFVRPALDAAREKIGKRFVIILARNIK